MMDVVGTILGIGFLLLVFAGIPTLFILIGASRRRAQADLAQRLGLTHVSEGPYGYLFGRFDGYDLRIEGAPRWHMSVNTSVRIDFVVFRPFRLRHEWLRGKKVATGDPALDDVYLLRSKNPDAARNLFADADVRTFTRLLHPLGVMTLGTGNSRLYASLRPLESPARVGAVLAPLLELARALDAAHARL